MTTRVLIAPGIVLIVLGLVGLVTLPGLQAVLTVLVGGCLVVSSRN